MEINRNGFDLPSMPDDDEFAEHEDFYQWSHCRFILFWTFILSVDFQGNTLNSSTT
jgi:hypothetical protein